MGIISPNEEADESLSSYFNPQKEDARSTYQTPPKNIAAPPKNTVIDPLDSESYVRLSILPVVYYIALKVA